MRIEELKDVYNKISGSYLTKKTEPWYELLTKVPELKKSLAGVLLDAGCGNGRNLKHTNRTLSIGLDFSEELLRNFISDTGIQRILGSVTKLPIRKVSIDEILSIAVIHHLPDNYLRMRSLIECNRCLSLSGSCIVTVWRKWRFDLKVKLFQYIRQSKPITELIDHERPWKDSSGNILGYRYYHYYTWKELYMQINQTNFMIARRAIMGGRNNDDNFLVELKKA